jgi:hypothetical protein
MAFVVLYVENADVAATFESLEAAQGRLNDFVRKHPDVRDEMAVVEVDEHGHGVGAYIYADSHAGLFAQRSSPALPPKRLPKEPTAPGVRDQPSGVRPRVAKLKRYRGGRGSGCGAVDLGNTLESAVAVGVREPCRGPPSLET